jgi:dihydrofolate synthase/folylpolyglutamate synthase
VVHTYQEALDYLYGFVPSVVGRPDPEINLTRTRALLQAFDNPQLRFPSVVIAGTKGKGSTTAMIAQMARAAGLRTGMWTSPHLHTYRERIQVDGAMIAEHDLIRLVNQIIPSVDHLSLSEGLPATFAIGFAIAMRYFAEAQIDIAVVEVGLGGRYDSANVLTPLVSVITSISYDHMDILGDTIDAIAMQKGGIAKPGVPLLVAPQCYAALVTVAACAAEAGAPCQVVDDAGTGGIRGYDVADEHVRGPIPELFDPYDVYHGAQQGALTGAFQSENTRLAVAAALTLRGRGLPIHDGAITQGLEQVRWPGRYEYVPIARGGVLLDGAHNVDSAQRLVDSLRNDFPERHITMVLGFSKDKTVADMVPIFAQVADQVIVTASRHPRALRDLGYLCALVQAVRHNVPVNGIEDPADALNLAMHHAVADSLIVVTGSLFVVAAGREVLGLAAVSDNR